MQEIKTLMAAYHAAKIPVIPLNEKRLPLIKEWSKYNEELPDECLWREGARGIGLLPGPESGISWIDVDTLESELLTKIESIIGRSPVSRFGSKGYASAYRYNPKIESRKMHKIGVEIFSNTGYVAIPPSHHEKTGRPIVWIGQQILKFDRDNLPEITEEMVMALERLNGSIVAPAQGGRNNALVSIVSAILQRGESIEFAAKEAYEADMKHNPRWFLDPEDKWKARTEEEAKRCAYAFVLEIAKGHLKKGYMPAQFVSNDEDIQIGDETSVEYKIEKLPEPEGMLTDFVNLVREISYTEIPNMSIGSSLAIFSTLMHNQFIFQDIKANMIMLLLGPSGTGKKFGMTAAQKILGPVGYLGSADYQSSNAIASTLQDYCVRLDVSEEFSKTLKLSGSGNSWQASIAQELCKLWDAPTENFQLPVLKIKKGEKAEPTQVLCPFVSILTSTTLTEFKDNITKSAFTSGFVPRFFIAMDSVSSKHAKVQLDYEAIEFFKKRCEDHVKAMADLVKPDMMGGVDPIKVLLDPAAESLFAKTMIKYDEETKAEESDLLKPVRSRFRQHYKKLALIHAVSCGRKHITEKDLNFAETFLAVSWNNYSRLLSEAGAENKTQIEKERLYTIILENPGITQNELCRKSQFIAGRRQRENLLLDLEEAGIIIRKNEITPGSKKAATRFFALRSGRKT